MSWVRWLLAALALGCGDGELVSSVGGGRDVASADGPELRFARDAGGALERDAERDAAVPDWGSGSHDLGAWNDARGAAPDARAPTPPLPDMRPPEPPEPDAGRPPAPGCDCYYGNGLYCATGVREEAEGRGCDVSVARDRPDALLRCTDGGWQVERDCGEGCAVAPPGQADACRAPADGQYRLPWSCGATYRCTQGNDGDTCGNGAGSHHGRQRFALDFGLPRGTIVVASRGGEVAFADNVSGPGGGCYDGCGDQACCDRCINSGNRVVVRHGDGTAALYLHLDEATVRPGQQVSAGEPLGRSGVSGCAFGAHLHFQLQQDCGSWFCDSLQVAFAENGTPGCGVSTPSGNCD